MSTLLFLTAIPLTTSVTKFKRPSSKQEQTPTISPRFYKPRRTPPTANINKTTDSNREDEIAAKIASLRKHKRLNTNRSPQQPSSSKPTDNDTSKTPTTENTTAPTQAPKPLSEQQTPDKSIFSQLPDWKKEEMLQQQMQQAEKFFQSPPRTQPPSPSPSPASPPVEPKDEESYKPKVSTWGVFPRPENISRKYGGGKKISPGGVDLSSESSKKRDADIKKKIESYRSSLGIDMKTEEAHKEEIKTALTEAEEHMQKSRAYDAIQALEGVTEHVSDRSQLGGKVLLSLALSYEAVGKRQAAKALYVRLKKSAFSDISSKAKQLLLGFAAMEMLRVPDEASETELRVSDFQLPDVNYASEKRYETVVLPDEQQSAAPISLRMNIILALVMLTPLLILAMVMVTKQ